MESLSQILQDYAFVAGYEVLKFERTQTVLRSKIVVAMRDGSRLFISEATTPRGFRYAYHWQDAEDRLLARWNNAPHHQDLVTFPDHFHSTEKIESSAQPTIREVFEYIAGRWHNHAESESFDHPK